MQERVSFTPPEIKLFEGKAPPASWFNENVVRYMQVKSQVEFLTNFLVYTKQLQSEKVSKSIPHAVEREAEMVSVSEKADPQEVANVLTFNALQPNIKAQIEGLEKLIVILQQLNPKLVPELNQALIQIKMIAKAFPALTEEQANLLTKTLKQLDENVKQLPLSSQRKYWEKQFSMLYEMWENLDQYLKTVENQMTQLKQNVNNLDALRLGIASLSTLFARMGGQNFTTAEIQQILSILQTVASGHSKLSPEGQNSLKSFMQQLTHLKSQNGKPLSGVASDAILKQWIQDYLQTHPDARQSEVKQYIQNLLDETGLNKSTLPFLSDMKKEIQQVITQPQFPFTQGISGIIFAQDQNGKVVLNPNFKKELEKVFTLDPKDATVVQNAKGEVEKNIDVAKDAHQKMYEGFAQARATGAGLKDSTGGAAATAGGNSSLSGSLPWDFQDAILHHYMPMQESYLMELAELLYFANFGAEMGNAILNKIDFSVAANSYDLSSYLHPTDSSDDSFTGNATDAQNALSNERNQAKTDMNDINSALNTIENYMHQINANTQMSPAQKTQLLKQLKTDQQNLMTAYGQVSNLYNTLKGVTIAQDPNNSNQFIIYGPTNMPQWLAQLNTNETVVVNGDPTSDPPGGLNNIESQLEADQQSYSDQSQTQQMMLQMRMTEIQQEWTVVSDSLQALNQMYMTLAQSIYK